MLSQIEDEINYFQIGFSEKTTNFALDIGPAEISAMKNYPSKYKFTGIEVTMGLSVK
jgi:hypothetical protein